MAIATVETKIWQALRAQVDVMGAAMALEVSFNADNFTPPIDAGQPEPYLICDLIPNVNSRMHHAAGDDNNRLGVMTISVMVPIALHYDINVDIQIAGTVATYFNDATHLRFDGQLTSITKAPDVSQRYRDDAYWRTPVTVQWQSFG